MSTPSAHEFATRILKSILQAPTPQAAVQSFSEIFEPDFYFFYNGSRLDRTWLEPHVHEVFSRLQQVKVRVTHAARDGNQLCERHIVTAVSADTGKPWEVEVLAAYDLSESGRIQRWHELSQVVQGEYSGW